MVNEKRDAASPQEIFRLTNPIVFPPTPTVHQGNSAGYKYPADIIHMPFPKCALLFTSHSYRPSTASLLIIPYLPIPMNNQWHLSTFCHLRHLVVHPTMN